MRDIGLLYDAGHGVPKDMPQAVTWYKKAADAGDSGSMRNLGLIYSHGEGGVPVPPAGVRAVVAGGMPGWQIAMIAVGAALLAAAIAVLLDRGWSARRRALAPTT